jgi:hypothetical protein
MLDVESMFPHLLLLYLHATNKLRQLTGPISHPHYLLYSPPSYSPQFLAFTGSKGSSQAVYGCCPGQLLFRGIITIKTKPGI